MSYLVKQPENLDRTLYSHQLNSIGMMEKREKMEIDDNIEEMYSSKIVSRVGIFSDMTGYGKTLAMVGLMLRDKMSFFDEEDKEDITNVLNKYQNEPQNLTKD